MECTKKNFKKFEIFLLTLLKLFMPTLSISICFVEKYTSSLGLNLCLTVIEVLWSRFYVKLFQSV